jgi:hypothetical protein
MSNSINSLFVKLEEYKSKYYKNQLIKGLLISLGLVLSVFLVVNFIEYFGRLNSTFRAGLFFSFVGLLIYTLVNYIGKPLVYFFKIKQPISNEDAAKDIGRFFPDISDRLLNTIQLASEKTTSENQLLFASIEQKSESFKLVKFADAINLSENKKYLKYVLPPVALLIFISAIAPSFFKSSERIIKFRKDFAQEAPFIFKVKNDNLKAVKNEDYTLKLELEGDALPEEVFLLFNERRFKMEPTEGSKDYSFTFSKVQNPINFNFIAAGFNSDAYEIDIINRPELLSFDANVIYPSYLGKKAEKLQNVGNMIIPEGTVIDWRFNAQHTDSMKIVFDKNTVFEINNSLINGYNYRKQFKQSAEYQIIMSNSELKSADDISYFINVIKDQFPKIQLEQIKDTVNYNYIVLGGSISDDYGFSDFKLKYKKKEDKTYTELPINYSPSQVAQTFFYQFDLFSLNLEQDDEVEYYLEVWDNDGVNGKKSTKTLPLTFALPNSLQFDKEVEKQVENTEKKMEKVLKQSKDLQKDLDKLDKQLKNKKKIDFQEKKQLEDLLKKREELKKELLELQKEFNKLQEKQNRFQEQSPELKDKMNQLQNLMNELMKNEELFKELEKLMDEKTDDEKIMEQLQKMKENERNLDKDIDRALKLFKNLQLKQKLEQTIKELEELAKKQEDLGEKTEESKGDKISEELKKEQEKLNEDFDDKKDKLKEIEKLSKELRKEIDTDKAAQEQISDDQEKSKDQMDQNDKSGASKSQKKAGKAMKSLAAAMAASMQSAEMQQLDLDIDALREILENLVKLSFDQEKTMKDLRGISKSDPRYVDLSQQQLKLVDDAKMIEDSLYSLSTRVMQIEAFVTKEVTKMNNSMDKSIQSLRDRDVNKASAMQQFSMTSMNNLALMLSDTFKQMQEMMANAMPGSGKSGKNGKTPMPGIGEQQQQINERMKGLGSSGMGGKEMSQELAKLANEQAKLRKRIQEMKEEMNGTEMGKKMGDQLSEIQKEMDKTENDLVNKRVTPQLMKRQQMIETRLLEAEKAIKEQELDPKRKSKTAIEINRSSPPALDEFFKAKQKQLELIRTTPPNFTPFYKSETDKYFQRIK